MKMFERLLIAWVILAAFSSEGILNAKQGGPVGPGGGGNPLPPLPLITITFAPEIPNAPTSNKLSSTTVAISPPQHSIFELNSANNPNFITVSSTDELLAAAAFAKHTNESVNGINEDGVTERYISKQTVTWSSVLTTTLASSASSSSLKSNHDGVFVTTKGKRDYAIGYQLHDVLSIGASYYFPDLFIYSGGTYINAKTTGITGWYWDDLDPEGGYTLDWHFEVGTGENKVVYDYDPNDPMSMIPELFCSYSFQISKSVDNNDTLNQALIAFDYFIDTTSFANATIGGIVAGTVNATGSAATNLDQMFWVIP